MKAGRFGQFVLDVLWVLFAQATVVLTVVLTVAQPDLAPTAWLITLVWLVGLFVV